MRLSVIVPATAPAPTLPRCLAALEAAGADEVLVADQPPLATPSLARNLASDRATGDVLYILDKYEQSLTKVPPRASDQGMWSFENDLWV
jgi:hypothetical protein